MNSGNIWRAIKSDYLKLVPVLGLAFYVAFIPHQNYAYPVHIDEWWHMAYAKAMMEAGSTAFANPFAGETSVELSLNLEAGFQLFWGVLHQISGVSWLSIVRYFPGVVLMVTVLSVYVLARREGFGWESAFFASLIPTTVGILGPAFFVPLAFALPFIPLSLFIAFNYKSGWGYLVLFIFTSFLLAVHAATAVGVAIILVPYILLNLKSDFKHSLWLTLAMAIPFLAPFPWIFDMLLPTAQSLLSPQILTEYVEFPLIIRKYYYLPGIFCLIGTFLLVMRGGKKNYGMVFGLLAMLLMLVIFFTFHYGVPIMYERGLIYMLLMVGVVAGAGLMAIRSLELPTKIASAINAPLITKNLGNILCLVLVVVTLVVSIPNLREIRYYHMIDDADYRAFAWIKENVGDKYGKAILDPWEGTAFTAITGKYVYARIHAYPEPSAVRAIEFLDGGSSNTTFLRENGISIVYTKGEVDNPDLVGQEMENVYLLKETGGSGD